MKITRCSNDKCHPWRPQNLKELIVLLILLQYIPFIYYCLRGRMLQCSVWSSIYLAAEDKGCIQTQAENNFIHNLIFRTKIKATKFTNETFYFFSLLIWWVIFKDSLLREWHKLDKSKVLCREQNIKLFPILLMKIGLR